MTNTLKDGAMILDVPELYMRYRQDATGRWECQWLDTLDETLWAPVNAQDTTVWLNALVRERARWTMTRDEKNRVVDAVVAEFKTRDNWDVDPYRAESYVCHTLRVLGFAIKNDGV